MDGWRKTQADFKSNSEAAFESAIEAVLLANGYTRHSSKEFDAEQAIFPEPEFSLTDSFFTTIRRNAVSKSRHVGSRNTPPIAGQVDPWILRGLTACAANPLTSREIQEATGLRHRETFQRKYLDQLLEDELLERTIPEKPTSRLQKYRLTEKGRALLEQLDMQGDNP